MAVNEAAIGRLMELGRQQGYVTVDQITTVLPVATMSEAEIAQAVDRLEQAGVQVELDQSWMNRHRTPDEDAALRTPPVEPVRAEEVPSEAEARPRSPAGERARPLERRDEGREEGPPLAGPAPERTRPSWLPMLLVGLVVLGLILVVALGWLG